MKSYQFKINSNDIDSTNESLMKLWASFLKNGKFAWYYRPYKNKNIIDVGSVSINKFGTYRVKFNSKTRKIVTNVIFEKENNKEFKKKEIEYFNKIDQERYKLSSKKFIVAISIKINSFFGIKYLYPFLSDFFKVYCIDDKQYIEFEINGFSKEEVSEKAFEYSQIIIDFLSTQLNSSISVENTCFLERETVISDEVENLEQDKLDWMDDYPTQGFYFILPRYAKKILNTVISNKIEDDISILLKATHHFSHATHLDEKKLQYELIISQLMSSVEVLSELEKKEVKKCQECGQNIYSIRKRVLNLIEKDLSLPLKKIFDNYYSSRSKYLHSGSLTFTRQYTGRSLPKISDKFPNGCDEYSVGKNINLIEWIGFLIRKKTQEIIFDEVV